MTGDDNDYGTCDEGDETVVTAEVKRPLLVARPPRLAFRVSGARIGDAARPGPTRARLLPSRRPGLRVHGAAVPKSDDEAAS